MGRQHVDELRAVDQLEVRLAAGRLHRLGRKFGGGHQQRLRVALAAKRAEQLVDEAAADRRRVALGLDRDLGAVAPRVDPAGDHIDPAVARAAALDDVDVAHRPQQLGDDRLELARLDLHQPQQRLLLDERVVAGDQGLDLRRGVGQVEPAGLLGARLLHVATPLDQRLRAPLGGRPRQARQHHQPVRQRAEVERLAGEERRERPQRARQADRLGEHLALVLRALAGGEQALAQRRHAQLAADIELDDAEDPRRLTVIREVAVVDLQQLEQGRRVDDAVADRRDELTNIAEAIGLRHIERTMQPIDPRRAGLADSGHVRQLARVASAATAK